MHRKSESFFFVFPLYTYANLFPRYQFTSSFLFTPSICRREVLGYWLDLDLSNDQKAVSRHPLDLVTQNHHTHHPYTKGKVYLLYPRIVPLIYNLQNVTVRGTQRWTTSKSVDISLFSQWTSGITTGPPTHTTLKCTTSEKITLPRPERATHLTWRFHPCFPALCSQLCRYR